MIEIFLLIILRSLSSVLCLNCSDLRQSKGLGIYVRRDREGGHSYWVYDRNGSEWEMHFKETDGEMDIDGYDDKDRPLSRECRPIRDLLLLQVADIYL